MCEVIPHLPQLLRECRGLWHALPEILPVSIEQWPDLQIVGHRLIPIRRMQSCEREDNLLSTLLDQRKEHPHLRAPDPSTDGTLTRRIEGKRPRVEFPPSVVTVCQPIRPGEGALCDRPYGKRPCIPRIPDPLRPEVSQQGDGIADALDGLVGEPLD